MCAHFILNLFFLCAWKRVKCHSAHNKMGCLFSYATLTLLVQKKNIRVIDSTALCVSHSLFAIALNEPRFVYFFHTAAAKIIIHLFANEQSIRKCHIYPTKIEWVAVSFMWNHLSRWQNASSHFFCVHTKNYRFSF